MFFRTHAIFSASECVLQSNSENFCEQKLMYNMVIHHVTISGSEMCIHLTQKRPQYKRSTTNVQKKMFSVVFISWFSVTKKKKSMSCNPALVWINRKMRSSLSRQLLSDRKFQIKYTIIWIENSKLNTQFEKCTVSEKCSLGVVLLGVTYESNQICLYYILIIKFTK